MVIYLGIDTVFGIDQALQKQVNIGVERGGGGGRRAGDISSGYP